MAVTKRFPVYVAYYDHTDTIVREDTILVRARDAAHAEVLALRSHEWNFAEVVQRVPAAKPQGVEFDLSIMNGR